MRQLKLFVFTLLKYENYGADFSPKASRIEFANTKTPLNQF